MLGSMEHRFGEDKTKGEVTVEHCWTRSRANFGSIVDTFLFDYTTGKEASVLEPNIFERDFAELPKTRSEWRTRITNRRADIRYLGNSTNISLIIRTKRS